MEEYVMLKRLAVWFTFFVVSFWVERMGWAEQGKTFLYISLSTIILTVLICIVLLEYDHFINNCPFVNGEKFFQVILFALICIPIILFAFWIATKFFNVNFYVAYQILTLGQCLYISKKKKND